MPRKWGYIKSYFLLAPQPYGGGGGKAQKNSLAILFWTQARAGEQHCLVYPKRMLA